MCGILGKIGLITNDERINLIKASIDIEHRGPDEKRTLSNNHLWITSTRLRVVGGASGEQPMNLESNFILAYNGEITNFREIDSNPSEPNSAINSDTYFLYTLLTNSDLNSIAKLEGHFAFAFWNESTSELILCRDSNGEKPLFYFDSKEEIAFSSSVDALLQIFPEKPELSEVAVSSYLRWGYIDESDISPFVGIKQVPAGTILIWRKNVGIVSLKDFSRVADTKKPSRVDKESSAELLEGVLSSVVSRFLDADLEVGVFLSGGLDSSLITSFAAERQLLKTFSIELPTSREDSDRALEISARLGTSHYPVKMKKTDFPELLAKYAEKFDTPISDSGIFPLMKLVQTARSEVRVALAGEGGDEIFAGYPWSYTKLLRKQGIPNVSVISGGLKIARRLSRREDRIVFFSHWLQSLEMMYLSPQMRRERFLKVSEFLSESELSTLGLLPKNENEEINSFELNDALAYDRNHYLRNNLLVKSDRASMAFGFELRLPFLSPTIVKFAQELEESLLIDFKDTKIILQEIAKRRMPWNDWNTKKTGLGIPLGWLEANTGFMLQVNKMLTNKKLASLNGLVNPAALKEISLKSMRNSWNLYMLLIWLEKRI